MLPLFYAAGHVNYTWDGLYCFSNMRSLPKSVPTYFLIFSEIWIDMTIETSNTRFRHKILSGLVGQVLRSEKMLRDCCWF